MWVQIDFLCIQAEVQGRVDHPEEPHEQPQLFGNTPLDTAADIATVVEPLAAESHAQVEAQSQPPEEPHREPEPGSNSSAIVSPQRSF